MNTKSNFAKYAITFLAGSVAVPVLTSKLAKKAYVYLTAGAFIARDSIMEGVEKVQATAQDVAVDAKVITDKYYADRDCCCEDSDAQEEA